MPCSQKRGQIRAGPEMIRTLLKPKCPTGTVSREMGIYQKFKVIPLFSIDGERFHLVSMSS